MTFKKKSSRILSIVLVVWLLFATAYVLYGEWGRFKRDVMERYYVSGRTDAITQVIQEAATCKAFPVSAGDAKVTLISVECLSKATQEQGGGE